jgi:hypothetical protein
MSILADLLVGKHESTSSSGKQSQTSTRGPSPQTRQINSLLQRMLLGQMAQPPNTAISVPTQQGISALQAMLPAMMQRSGGSIAGGLTAGPPNMGGSYLPGPGQAGLQTREQLGLPDRQSYFPFGATPDQLKQVGIPALAPAAGQKNVANRYAKAGPKKKAQIKKRHPEFD